MAAGSMRAADTDRERVVALLVRHCGAGRLSMAELEARVGEAYAAVTLAELDQCLRELPPLPPGPPPVPESRESRLRRFLRRPTPRWAAVGAVVLAFAIGRQTDEPDVRVEPSDSVEAEEVVPELPPPGTQPADRAAAELLVHDAFAKAFNGTSSNEVKGQAVEDPESLRAASEDVRQRFPQEVRASVVAVRDLVFTAPTEAYVHFDIDYGAGTIGERRGPAVLAEGRWRVGRETVCEVLQHAGAAC